MSIQSNKFRNGLRAAILALTLGASGVAAMPAAQAAGPAFNFQFNSGGGAELSFRDRDRGHRVERQHRACYSDRQIIRQLRGDGFRNIDFIGGRGDRVRVEADRSNYRYILLVNRCNGNIAQISRERHRWNRFDRGSHRSGLQFNFRF